MSPKRKPTPIRTGDVVLVYVTAPDVRTAKTLARKAVKGRLAACANIFPGIHSMYRWNGKREDARETALLLKTTGACLAELEATLRAAHPYDCPCIVHWPLSGGAPDFLKWIRAETGGRKTPEHPGIDHETQGGVSK